MRLVGAVTFLMAIGAMSGGGTSALASEGAPDEIAEVTVVASRLDTPQPYCRTLSKDDARSQAADASRQGNHQRAGDCYLQAGDHLRADRAYVKATRLAAIESSQRSAAAMEGPRDQARRIRATFRRR